MSRFSGWTMRDVERLSGDGVELGVKVKRNRQSADGPDYVGMISGALSILGIDHVREYKFLHDRRFRFDIAVPVHRIAVEFEGGIYNNGRHTRGTGYAKDAKKYNLAVRHGWKLLRYTTADVKKTNWEFKVASDVKQLIFGDSINPKDF